MELDVDEILKKWSCMEVIKPICKTINVIPRTKKEQFYEQKIRESLQKHKIIKNFHSCYLYITFRKRDDKQKYYPDSERTFPDVDNLFKTFSDAIKNGVLLENDRQIIGVKANVVKVPNKEKQNISFTLIPTYNLTIHSVDEIKDMNELREKYWKLSLSNKTAKITKKPEGWNHPMQMIKTNHGIFFDNLTGDLWGVSNYRDDELLHKPEPGFDWGEIKNGETVNGVMLFRRSFCWWINKWT